MSDPAHSGMIGLGNMGGRIARRIHGAGLAVPATTSTRARRPVGRADRGLRRRAPRRARVVFLSLPDSRVVESVVYGEDGLLAACGQGQIVVDLSTSAPARR